MNKKIDLFSFPALHTNARASSWTAHMSWKAETLSPPGSCSACEPRQQELLCDHSHSSGLVVKTTSH